MTTTQGDRNEIGLGEVVRRLDRIDESLHSILRDHESRLRSLERWSYAVPPTLIIAGGSIFATVLKG